MRIFRAVFSRRSAFTLIEILVVISILGALAGIVIPNVIKFRSAANEPAKEVELHNVQVAVGSAMADVKVKTLDGAPVVLSSSNDVTVTNLETGDSTSVGNFLIGGVTRLQARYQVFSDGSAALMP